MNIQESLFRRRVRKHQHHTGSFTSYDHVRSVIILYESDYQERNTLIKQLRDELLAQNKDVVLWGYCPKKEIDSLVLPQSRIVGTKDFRLFGMPKASVVADLQKRQYDLLIDLTQHPILPLRYLALYVHSNFKAGMHIGSCEQGDQIHDLLIQTPAQDTPKFLYEQIIKYLQVIR